jgi:hypothetical protein
MAATNQAAADEVAHFRRRQLCPAASMLGGRAALLGTCLSKICPAGTLRSGLVLSWYGGPEEVPVLYKLPLVVFLAFLSCCFASLLEGGAFSNKYHFSLFDRVLGGMLALGASGSFFCLGGLVIASQLGASAVAKALGVAAVIGASIAILAVLTGATHAIWNRVVGKQPDE